MKPVDSAIEAGRCSVAVSGSLLRDPEVVHALTLRAPLKPMALSGPVVAPIVPVGEEGLARAVGQGKGVLVLVEPETADTQGLQEIATLIGRSQHKPKVLVAARSFNPFQFALALRGLQVEHLKIRSGQQFIKELPMPPSIEEAPLPEVVRKDRAADTGAPRFVFVGREEEVPALVELLGRGGGTVVHGPPGVGRTLLVEHAIAEAGLTRYPDLALGWGVGADTLFGRLAAICEEHGQEGLTSVLSGAHTPAEAVAAAIAALQAAEGAADRVMVVRDLQVAIGREGDFFRKGRLEMLVEALLTNEFPLRMVFLGTHAPVFFKEGQQAALQQFPVPGLKGRFLHEIFEAWRAPEFPREKFGPISEKIHGHPLAARTYAVLVRDREDGGKLLDDPKFFRMEGVEDVETVKKQLGKKVDKLPKPLRHVLATIAHFRVPMEGSVLADLGVNRKDRMELVAQGLLDMVGTQEARRYMVHPLVRSTLSLREITDFDTMAQIGALFEQMGRGAEGVERIAIVQETNQCAVGARVLHKRIKLKYPDNDAMLESVEGILRMKEPRLDIAEQRVNEVLGSDSSNAEAWSARAEIMGRGNASNDEILAVWEEAMEKAAVPDLFHRAVNFLLQRKARPKAAEVLEKAVETFPEEPRLRTRLAAVYLRLGRRNEAIEQLRKASELAPMLPDAYGLLGMARRDEGVEALGEAEELLREAVRLAPEDPTQVGRLVDLLMEKARVRPEERDAILEEARLLLEEAIKGDRRAPEAWLLFAQVLREQGADLERAEWFLKRARKLTDRQSDRRGRIVLEQSLIDVARGNLDAAEKQIRDLTSRDPSNPRVFIALAEVLEKRELLIPAHAEYMRAKERTPKDSLLRQEVDANLARLQQTIEAQAGLVAQAPHAAPAAPAPRPTTTEQHSHQRVIRRRKQEEAAPEKAHGEADAEAVGEVAEGAHVPVAADEPTAAAEPERPHGDELAEARDAVVQPETQEAAGEAAAESAGEAAAEGDAAEPEGEAASAEPEGEAAPDVEAAEGEAQRREERQEGAEPETERREEEGGQT